MKNSDLSQKIDRNAGVLNSIWGYQLIGLYTKTHKKKAISKFKKTQQFIGTFFL